MIVELVPLLGPAIERRFRDCPPAIRVEGKIYDFTGVIVGRMVASGLHRHAGDGHAEALLQAAPDVVVYLERR